MLATRWEAVSRKELIGRLRDGLVTVLDVRPEDELRSASSRRAHIRWQLEHRLD